MKFSFTDYKEITFCGRFEIFNFIGSVNYILVIDSKVKTNFSILKRIEGSSFRKFLVSTGRKNQNTVG